MQGLLIRWIVLTLAILVTAYFFDGIHVSGFFSAFFTAATLGILNAFFRPVLLVITLPINILSMGLFTFIINAVLLLMASGVIPGFKIAGFWSAVFGSIMVSLVSWILNLLINPQGKVEIIALKNFHDK